jgi:hypothetical protein
MMPEPHPLEMPIQEVTWNGANGIYIVNKNISEYDILGSEIALPFQMDERQS